MISDRNYTSIILALSDIVEDTPGCYHFSGDPTYANLVWETTAYTKPTESEYDAAVAAKLAALPLQELREVRDKKLAETDWWELPTHAPMSTARTNYRQALRDITDTYTTLDTVVWPEKPA